MACTLASVETVEGSSSQPPAPNPAGAAAPHAPAAASAPPEQQADLLSLLSVEGARRTAGSLCGIVSQFAGVEGLVGLHGGLPPTSSFPLTSLQFGLADGRTVQLSGTQLAAAQQYNLGPAGYPPLLAWVKAHVQQLHAPPGANALLITDGASHGLEIVCSLFLDSGDWVVAEEFTYPQLLECQLAPRGCHVLPVPMDGSGMLPAELERLLEQHLQSGKPLPKMLYTVPAGQNPTGVSTALERKRAVYDICCRHGILIVEDDPYFYLQFPSGPQHPPGLAGLPRASSYLSLDTQGRVIRLDSFAKFLAPGLRLGWAAAPPAVIDKMTQVMQAQTLGASGVSQAITAEMLASWGEEGLHSHLAHVQAQYALKAAALHGAAQRELAGLAEWQELRAGMFMWVRLLGVEEGSDILASLRDERVVVVPGRICHPRAADPAFRCPYLRLSFANPPPEELEEGVRRLAAVLRRLQQQRQVQEGG